ncbi:MAG: hypothetical protein ABFS46_17945 [Myxococcota bacterium]
MIQLALSRQLSASAWLAVRAQGSKIGEKPTAAGTPRLSIAHSAPIYVNVAGSAAIGDQPKATFAKRGRSSAPSRESPNGHHPRGS